MKQPQIGGDKTGPAWDQVSPRFKNVFLFFFAAIMAFMIWQMAQSEWRTPFELREMQEEFARIAAPVGSSPRGGLYRKNSGAIQSVWMEFKTSLTPSQVLDYYHAVLLQQGWRAKSRTATESIYCKAELDATVETGYRSGFYTLGIRWTNGPRIKTGCE